MLQFHVKKVVKEEEEEGGTPSPLMLAVESDSVYNVKALAKDEDEFRKCRLLMLSNTVLQNLEFCTPSFVKNSNLLMTSLTQPYNSGSFIADVQRHLIGNFEVTEASRPEEKAMVSLAIRECVMNMTKMKESSYRFHLQVVKVLRSHYGDLGCDCAGEKQTWPLQLAIHTLNKGFKDGIFLQDMFVHFHNIISGEGRKELTCDCKNAHSTLVSKRKDIIQVVMDTCDFLARNRHSMAAYIVSEHVANCLVSTMSMIVEKDTSKDKILSQEIIQAAGMIVNAKMGPENRTILNHFCEYPWNKVELVTDLVAKNDTDLGLVDKNGNTAFHVLMMGGQIFCSGGRMKKLLELAEVFVRHGAELDLKNKAGKTVLDGFSCLCKEKSKKYHFKDILAFEERNKESCALQARIKSGKLSRFQKMQLEEEYRFHVVSAY